MASQPYTYNTQKSVTGSADGDKNRLDVSSRSGAYRSSFGDYISESMEPISQISAQYGILGTVETFNATGGSTTTETNMFKCTTGTSVGGYGVIRTKRPTIYREGQGMMARFTALFDSTNAVDNSLQFAGLFNVQDTIAFGYRGTDFGILFDNYGAQEAQEFQITGAGNGNLTITLNSVNYVVPVTTGTVEHNCYEIEAWFSNPSNQTLWDAEQIDDKVIFRNKNAAAAAGTYSYSGASVTGSFTQLTAGAAKTASTILQADWNGDSISSSYDPSKGNIYMIKVSYLGFGPIKFYIMDPDTHEFVNVHTIEYANNYTQPSISNRSLKVGWTAASLGSTTDITIKGASAATFIEGKSTLTAESHAQSNSNTSVSTSFEAILTIRADEVFGGKANLGRVVVQRIEVSTDSTKEVVVKLSKNATLGETDYTYHDEGDSMVAYDIGDHADGGEHAIFETQIGSGGATSINLKSLNIDFFSTESITVFAKVVSGSASDVTATLVWKEDL